MKTTHQCMTASAAGEKLHSLPLRPARGLLQLSCIHKQNDMQHALSRSCDPYTNKLLSGVDMTTCCHSNLTRAAKSVGLEEEDVHDVLNVFMCTGFTPRGGKYFAKPSPVQKGDYIEFLAEIDLIVGLSTCPQVPVCLGAVLTLLHPPWLTYCGCEQLLWKCRHERFDNRLTPSNGTDVCFLISHMYWSAFHPRNTSSLITGATPFARRATCPSRAEPMRRQSATRLPLRCTSPLRKPWRNGGRRLRQ